MSVIPCIYLYYCLGARITAAAESSDDIIIFCSFIHFLFFMSTLFLVICLCYFTAKESHFFCLIFLFAAYMLFIKHLLSTYYIQALIEIGRSIRHNFCSERHISRKRKQLTKKTIIYDMIQLMNKMFHLSLLGC